MITGAQGEYGSKVLRKVKAELEEFGLLGLQLTKVLPFDRVTLCWGRWSQL